MQISRYGFAVLSVLLSMLSSCGSAAGELPDFEAAPGFFQLPDSIQLGACSGVAIGRQGRIFLFHRGQPPVICCDKAGTFQRGWGADLIHTAHGIRIDRDGHVWVTDIGNHRVLKFTPDGKLLLALGTLGQAGQGNTQFDKPTDVGFGPSGEIYVADGYGNSRIVKFSPRGAFLHSWGRRGKQPGQFHLPHAILVDSHGRVLVGDRENDRIQVFDDSGKLLQIWPGFAPYGLAQDRQGHVFVADGRAHKILLLDKRGKVARSWGSHGKKTGQFQLPHMLAADAGGNLIEGEITGQRFQKLVRKHP